MGGRDPPRSQPILTGIVTRAIRLLAVAALTGCTAGDPPAACLLPGQTPMLVAELFFGRAIPGRAPLTDDEWRAFSEQVIGPAFPDGFTTFDGAGQWRDPQTGAVAQERTKILLVAVAPSPRLPATLGAVIDEYRRRFDQKSVGVITRTACGAF
jgi:Protein of unknown function (DUF3574)